jgi:leader peptidase (prepilin peptidase)/N-methyltransferase
MLYRQWREQCESFLTELNEKQSPQEKINLLLPRSHCPHCKQSLKAWHNIPLISYCWQRGKCPFCQTKISPRYPLVEITSALSALLLVLYFGWSYQLIFALIFTWSLIALIFVDLDEQLLPDQITLTLLWLGLLINTQNIFTDITSAVYGAIAGYLCLWIVAKAFWLVSQREGMGHGDFKLLAALGAWLGWIYLLPILLLSSFLGAIIGIGLIAAGKIRRENPIPFGPFLAIAGWVCLLWGDTLLHWLGWEQLF